MRPGILITGIVGGAVAIGSAAAVLGSRPIEQPIQFNHQLHIDKVGLDCTECHLYATTGPRATIPNIEVCSGCHEEPVTESAQEARLVEYIRNSTPVPWRKIHSVPNHVYFSHLRHTAIAKIECETCHGNVKERVRPFTRPVKPVSMNWCIDCHDKSDASRDCVSCHE